MYFRKIHLKHKSKTFLYQFNNYEIYYSKRLYVAAVIDVQDMYKRVPVASIKAILKHQCLRPHTLCLHRVT
jgi:hypothetical protein